MAIETSFRSVTPSKTKSRPDLHPIHRGVYAVGHRPRRRETAWIAAVLAAGPDAVLGFRCAAALWCIRASSGSRVEVIAPRLRRRPGIAAHCIALADDEVTVEEGTR